VTQDERFDSPISSETLCCSGALSPPILRTGYHPVIGGEHRAPSTVAPAKGHAGFYAARLLRKATMFRFRTGRMAQ
jgi:hypothetical protein